MLTASALAILYPRPAFYEWSNEQSSWVRGGPQMPEYGHTSARQQEYFRPDRRLIFEYEDTGRVRADHRRIAIEVLLVCLVGTGLIWAIKPQR
jgi:hypothetical protein